MLIFQDTFNGEKNLFFMLIAQSLQATGQAEDLFSMKKSQLNDVLFACCRFGF